MNMRRTCVIGALVCVIAAVVSITAAAAPTAKQRIAIEERGDRNGTFKLIPLTPGPLKADAGTWMFLGDTQLPTVIRNGQQVTRYRGSDGFKGKYGTFRLSVVSFVVDAGGGFQAGTQTWSFRSGTGAYSGLGGGGAGAFVATPHGGGGDRFEGYVTIP